MAANTGRVITPAERKTLLEGPLGALLLLPAGETQGQLSVVEHPLAARALGSPVHTHQREDEYSIVLEGTVGVQIGEQTYQAGPGAVIVKPRGVPHAFWNPIDEPARLLDIIVPGGFEGYFAEMGRALGTGGPPDMGALRAVAERYGLEIEVESIPRLAAAHGLNLDGRVIGENRPEDWNAMYAGTPPWDISRPQPTFVALADVGRLRGKLLDVGCGTGEQTLLAAAHGADALGIDLSERAIARARAKAAEQGLHARFEIGDALHLERLGEQFDTLIDSGVFHIFDDTQRAEYVASLAAAAQPGGMYYVLCFSDRTPGEWGPRRVRREELEQAFADGWTVESIEPARFEVVPGMPAEYADAWLAAMRRTA